MMHSYSPPKRAPQFDATAQRITAAFAAVAEGLAIDLQHLPKVYALGAEAIIAGHDDEKLREVMGEYLRAHQVKR